MTKHKILFFIILLIASFFRFWQIDKLPPSLNWDEISHGYNSYSLLNTGRDQWGQSWPIFNFRAYGDYPLALNLYLTMPFISLLGLNALSIRLPAAILSTLFCVGVYLLIRLILKSRSLSLIGFTIACFSPWTFFPSRAVFQSNLAQFFLLYGIVFFYLFKDKSNKLIYSSIFFGLSMYSYHNTRLVAPIIFFFLYFLFKKFNKKNIFSIFLFLIFAIPNLINLFASPSLARNRWVGIINPISINVINEQRRIFEGPYLLNIAAHNKVVYFSTTFLQNIIEFLNPITIFFKGSQNYQFNPPNSPLIFPIFLPFFYLGFIYLLINFNKTKNYLFIVFSFFVTLIPAALTTGDFPSIRLTIATPFYYLFIIYGFWLISQKTKGYLVPSVIILTLTLFFQYFQFYSQYAKTYASSWQYGYESMVSYLKNVYPQYDHIFITKKYGEPHEFILFYWPWDSALYQKDSNLSTNFHSDWYWVDAFDKFVFLNDWEIKDRSIPPKSLLITSPSNYPLVGSNLEDTLFYPNNTPVFDIVSYE